MQVLFLHFAFRLNASVSKCLSSLVNILKGWFDYLVVQINNVGTNIRKPVVDFTEEDFSTLMATNFESVFHTSQLAYPLLKTSGSGSIVFVSSVSGFVSLKSMSVQGATKGNYILVFFLFCFLGLGSIWILSLYNLMVKSWHLSVVLSFIGAINQLTKNLACEWAKDNIRSNAVAPWYIRTSMVEKVISLFYYCYQKRICLFRGCQKDVFLIP